MKIKIYVFCMLFFIAYSAYSQEGKFKLLFIAGANASQVNGDKLAGFDKFGLYSGLGIKRQINTKSSWQFELLYSEKGSKDVNSANNILLDTLFKFNYIDIPIVYTYRVWKKIDLQAGVYTGVLLNAVYDDYVNEFDRNNQIRKIDNGLCAAVEYELNKNWIFNLRLSQSMLDINNSFETYYNMYTSFSIRYQL